MIRAFLFDLSRTLLFPVDTEYKGELNKLHSELSLDPNYNFLDYFSLDKSTLNYLSSIKGKYDLYIFTSGSIQNDPAIKPELENVFKKIYSAEKIGLSKKDPKSYEFIAKDIGRTPDEILYIDDSEVNIKAAKMAHYNTVLFSELEELRRKIAKVLKN